MKKRKLDLDELDVETFETAESSRERGTVIGHATLRACTLDCTANYSCGGTCGYESCHASACCATWQESCGGYGSCYPNATCGEDYCTGYLSPC